MSSVQENPLESPKRGANSFTTDPLKPSLREHFNLSLPTRPLSGSNKVELEQELQQLDSKALDILRGIDDPKLYLMCLSELKHLSVELQGVKNQISIGASKQTLEDKPSLLEKVAENYRATCNALSIEESNLIINNFPVLLKLDSQVLIASLRDNEVTDGQSLGSLLLQVHGATLFEPSMLPLFSSKEGIASLQELGSLLQDKGLVFSKSNLTVLTTLTKLTVGTERSLNQEMQSILERSKDYDQLCPGTGVAYLLYMGRADFTTMEEWDNADKALQRYIVGLAIQGEPAIQKGVSCFVRMAENIRPDDELVKNLLLIHRQTGFLHFSRLLSEEQRTQVNMEQISAEIAHLCVDPKYNENEKTAVIVFSGLGDVFGDAFSADSGRLLAQLREKGYRIIPFEVHTDEQATLATERAVKLNSGPADLLIFAAHGSSSPQIVSRMRPPEVLEDGFALGLGNTDFVSDFIGTSTEATKKLLMELPQEEQEWINAIGEGLDMPAWKVKSVVNDAITQDQGSLDRDDVSEFKGIVPSVKAELGRVIFYACGAALPTAKPSVAERFAEVTHLRTYAPRAAITHMHLIFDDQNRVRDVEFSDHGLAGFVSESKLKTNPDFSKFIKPIETFRGN